MPLIASKLRRHVAAVAAMLTLGTVLPASANPYACQRYKAELASLTDNGSTQRALQSEIGRLQSYYRSLNCEGGRFLFFDTRPPQCGAVEQRIKALNAGYGAQNGEVVAARRRQLVAAIGTACTNTLDVPSDGSPLQQTARGGHKVICVKTCDGSYFPMNNLPDGRGGADEMCQALCPGTQAVAYSMPEGDEALRSAATVKGNRAYTALATAFKFRTSFEPSCSCKQEGKGWAQSLAKAESMLFRHKGDIFVTPMQAERLSRPPKVRLTLVGRADKTAATLAADAASRNGATGETAGDVTATGTAGPADASAAVAKANADRTAVRVIEPSMIPIPARTGTP
ncbi:DUF2865 domain-containing protein [Methylobacterium sp. C25]|uniref:DUF2865 domain-containing protein n=1 Tax=Methylobacterium sp. C25 TaxID=2721622 RepID=UPI001F369E18|nr:DUF2865 domain-containing protein [Methylobacterium sp. C25]MCE4222988.1 DUF2865 domain-containing protein [Methylobacterium sp. C25]